MTSEKYERENDDVAVTEERTTNDDIVVQTALIVVKRVPAADGTADMNPSE